MAVSAAVATGLFSIGGVVVGGVLTAAITDHRERRNAERESRRARELAAIDLERALEAVHDVKDAGETSEWQGQWPPGWERAAWTESWSGYRGMLADGLDDPKTFVVVARAFGSLVQLERGLASVHDFQPSDRVFLERVERRLTAAQQVLPVADKALAEPA